MLDQALLAAASSGATTLVTAMATDGWKAARSGMSRLLGRGDPGRQAAVEAHLDEHDAAVRSTADADALLLERSPEVAGELRQLTARIQSSLSPAQQAWISAHTIVQHVTASGQGSIAGGAIGGNVIFQDRPQ
jgi:hypothetical protein